MPLLFVGAPEFLLKYGEKATGAYRVRISPILPKLLIRLNHYAGNFQCKRDRAKTGLINADAVRCDVDM